MGPDIKNKTIKENQPIENNIPAQNIKEMGEDKKKKKKEINQKNKMKSAQSKNFTQKEK